MGRGRILVGAVTLLYLFIACARAGGIQTASARPARTADRREVLRGATPFFPDHLDPQLSFSAEGWTAMYDTYVPLLTYRHAGGKAGSEVIPGLAKSLPKITDRGKTYTLILRRGLRYSNGRPVRASDFKFAIERLLQLRSGGAFYYLEIVGAEKFMRTRRGGIAGIRTDDRTGRVVIHLVEPQGEFASLLALLFAAPVPRGTQTTDRTADPPPATGPYVITGSRPGHGWVYARNPAWSKNARRMPQLPGGHMDRISIRVIHRSSARIRAVEDGKVDWTSGWLPHGSVAELRRKYKGTRFQSEPTLNTYYFWMNTRKAPFNDVRVRAAVNYAVDSSEFQRIYAGEIHPTQQILPPGMPGYKKFVPYRHNLARARRLIAEAHPSDRKITVWTDNESVDAKAGAYYCGVLTELGFTVHLKVISAGKYYTAIGKTSRPNLDTGLSDWFADYPHPNNFFESLLASWSIWPSANENLAQVGNPLLDQWIALLRAKSWPIPEGRYAQLDRISMALAPWVPIGNLRTPIFVSKAVPLNRLTWNPSFGVDLTSLRFR